MSPEEWVTLDEADGSLQAEILRGLLESQGIQVLLSQEGAGHSVFTVTIGPLGRVEILVPSSQLAIAQQVLEEYRAGAFDSEDEGEENEAEEEG